MAKGNDFLKSKMDKFKKSGKNKKKNKDNMGGSEYDAISRFDGKESWLGSVLGDKETREMHRKLRERYQIDKPRFVKMDSGKVQEAHQERMTYGARMSRAMNNDYDVRRGMEAMALSGDEDAKRFAKKGIRNFSDVTNAYNMYEDKFLEDREDDKEFGSRGSFAKVSFGAVKDERKHQEDSLVSKSFLESKLNELQLNTPAQAQQQAEDSDPAEAPVSDRLSSAQQFVDDYEGGLMDTVSPFESDNPFADFGYGNRVAEGQQDANNMVAPDEDEQSVSKAQQLLAETKAGIADTLKPIQRLSPGGF